MAESFTYTNPYSQALLQAEAQKRQGEQLRASALDPMQGQMVGQHYVMNSPTQGFAKILRAKWGADDIREADKKSTQVATDRNKALAAALAPQQEPPEYVRSPDWEPEALSGRLMSVDPDMALQLRAREENSNRDLEQRRTLADEQFARQQQLADTSYGRQQEMTAEQRAWQAEQAQLNRDARLQYGQTVGNKPYSTPIQTSNGWMQFNTRTGQLEALTGPDGQQLMPISADIGLARGKAAATAGGKLEGKTQTEAAISQPKVVEEAEQVIGLVDQLLEHPGFSSSVGAKGPAQLFGALNEPIAGTDAAGWHALHKQMQGKQFLQAFESLKGAGQITEIEGQKAAAAMSAMQTASSEKDFIAAANEFKTQVRKGVELAAKKANGSPGLSTPPSSPDIPSPQTEEDFAALPSGTVYIDPDDGKQYRKP